MKPSLAEPKRRIAQAFGQAAGDYEPAARLQGQVADRLAREIASLVLPAAPEILEIGCGTGVLGRLLLPRLRPGCWFATDIAAPMVDLARQRMTSPVCRFAVMDGERPSLLPAPQFDLICSSLTFQWFEDLPGSLNRLSRLLRPGGWLAFSTLADGSFQEWQAACSEAGVASGIRDYRSPAALRAACPPAIHPIQAMAAEPVTMAPVVLSYADAATFLGELKQLGTGVPRPGYRPLSPGDLRRILRRRMSEFQVTYNVAYCLFQMPGDLATMGHDRAHPCEPAACR